MNRKVLYGSAVAGQVFSLFPFVVAAEGIGFGRYTWWHYPVIFAVIAAFYAAGRFTGSWAQGSGFSEKKKGWALFWSRVAVAVPTAAFILVCALGGLSTGLYLYVLPACIIAYYGGHHTVGMGYSDVFSRGWFALYFVTALVSSGLLWFTHEEVLTSAGGFQLCFGFGVLIVLAAVLTNQTNIDTRTAQRSAGRSVLPGGLRGYNAALIAAVCAVTVGLFLFAGPLAELLGGGIKALLALIISLIKGRSFENSRVENEFLHEGESVEYTAGDNLIYQLMQFLLAAGIILLAVRFRKQIWAFIKEFFAPLFTESVAQEEAPFIDEITDAVSKSAGERARRKSEQQLFRRYRKETDPVLKYRTGYALFLLRLARSPFPQAISDTTTIHSQKGTSAFRREDISGMVEVYNDVRYGGRVPTAEETAVMERIIEELR